MLRDEIEKKAIKDKKNKKSNQKNKD